LWASTGSTDRGSESAGELWASRVSTNRGSKCGGDLWASTESTDRESENGGELWANTESSDCGSESRGELRVYTEKEVIEPGANTSRGNEGTDPETIGDTSHSMASQKNSHRKSNGAENGSLAPSALARLFGEDEDIMEIDSPAQSLKRLLEEKAKNEGKSTAQGKRTREVTKGTPSQKAPLMSPPPYT
jgi:hypothetical protein